MGLSVSQMKLVVEAQGLKSAGDLEFLKLGGVLLRLKNTKGMTSSTFAVICRDDLGMKARRCEKLIKLHVYLMKGKISLTTAAKIGVEKLLIIYPELVKKGGVKWLDVARTTSLWKLPSLLPVPKSRKEKVVFQPTPAVRALLEELLLLCGLGKVGREVAFRRVLKAASKELRGGLDGQ